MKRRTFLVTAAAAMGAPAFAQSVPEAIRNLRPMTDGIEPITDDERRARVEKARRLIRENKIGAVVCEGGASMFYFTGTRWMAGDALFAWVLLANGEPVWVVPEANRDRAARAIRIGNGIRAWKESGDAWKLVIDATGRTDQVDPPRKLSGGATIGQDRNVSGNIGPG